jgi:hypothetical protein
MKIKNRDGHLDQSHNQGVIGDGNVVIHAPSQSPPGPVIQRTKVTPFYGLTPRHLMAAGGAGFLTLLFATGVSAFGIIGSAASIESAYQITWAMPVAVALMSIGLVGFMLRRNRVVQLPLLTLERGRSGKLYSTRYTGTCEICGGRLHHLRFASEGFRTFFECENNAFAHRGPIDLSKLPDVEDDQ